ncbi:MAG: sodium:proton antiporter [Pseudomonadota bacterium]
MGLFNIIAVLVTLAALFAYINYRYIKLPTTIGLMFISIIMSLCMVILGHLGQTGHGLEMIWLDIIRKVDFNKSLMVGMLSFLLFAGALHVDLNELLKQKWQILVFSTIGVMLSTLMVGYSAFLFLGWLGINLNLIYCLLFGALISPTDPIAVLGILKKAGVAKNLEIKITGESLFNDGVGVVIFITLLKLIDTEADVSPLQILLFFAKETLGGVTLGLITGLIAYYLLKTIDNYQTEILITLALVMGCYALATAIHFSGPIAIVIAGLLIGNHGRQLAMSEKTRGNLDTFWELIDEILNAVLFVLIGIELLVIALAGKYFIAGFIAIPVVLCARFLSIGIPQFFMPARKRINLRSMQIMTWGGLRGGISVALALSLPLGYARDAIITMTYIIVVFSIIVQGLTIKYIVKQ